MGHRCCWGWGPCSGSALLTPAADRELLGELLGDPLHRGPQPPEVGGPAEKQLGRGLFVAAHRFEVARDEDAVKQLLRLVVAEGAVGRGADQAPDRLRPLP